MITDSKFEGISSQNPGKLSILVALEQANVVINNSKFQKLGVVGNYNGGIFLFQGKSADLKIQNNTYFESVQTMSQGGIVYYETDYCNLTIQNSQIQHVYWNSNGGGIVYMKGLYNQVNLQNVKIYYQQQEYQMIAAEQMFLNMIQLNQSGLLQLNGEIQQIEFDQLYFQNSTQVSGPLYGGVIYSSSATTNFTLNCKNSTFNQVSSSSLGSFLYIDPLATPNISIKLVGNNFSIGQLEVGYEKYYLEMKSLNNNLLSENGYLVGGLFYIQNGFGALYSQENNFKAITTTRLTSVFHLPKNIRIYDKKSFYFQCESENGIFLCNNCTLVLDEIRVINWQGKIGGLINMIDQANVFIVNSVFMYGQVTNKGGAIYANGVGSSYIKIINTSISNVESQQDGGLIYSENPDLMIKLDNVTLKQILAKNFGGIIYAKQSQNIQISNSQCTLLQSGNTQGNMIYSEHQGLTVQLDNNYFEGQNKQQYEKILSQITSYSGIYMTSLITLVNAKRVTTFNNTFKNFYVATSGSVYSIEDTEEFIDQASTYNFLAAINGGVFQMSNVSQILLRDQIFLNSTAVNGGILQLIDNYNTTILNGTFNSVRANQDGGLINIINLNNLYSKSFLVISGYNLSEFQNFRSYGNGALIYADDSSIEISISYYKASNFKASKNGGFIFIEQASSVFIKNVQAQVIQALVSGSVLFSKYKNLKIKVQNSTFIQSFDDGYNKTQIKQNFTNNLYDPAIYTGGAFYFQDTNSVIEISNITVQNFHNVYQGGAFYLENSSLQDIGSNYTKNFALQGGFVYCKNCSILTFTSKFDNQSAIQGGVIYSSLKSRIEFQQSSFNNTYVVSAGGFLYTDSGPIQMPADIQNSSSIIILNGTTLIANFQSDGYSAGFDLNNPLFDIVMNFSMITISNLQSVYDGNVFYIKSANRVIIDGMIARNVRSSLGQGSFLWSNNSNTQIIIKNSEINCQNNSQKAIERNYFAQNLLLRGSAISFQNSNIPLISEKNNFKYCENVYQGGIFKLIKSELQDLNSNYSFSSAQQGGAIYCQKCRLNITNSNFTNQLAQEGSAFYIQEYDSSLQNALGKKLRFNNQEQLISKFDTSDKCGGTILFNEDYYSPKSLRFLVSEVVAKNLSSETYGAFICSYQGLLQLEIDRINVTQSKASKQGGIFHIFNIDTLKIKNSYFANFDGGVQGSFLSTDYYGVMLTLELINNTLIELKHSLIYDKWSFLDTSSGMMYLNFPWFVNSINNSYSDVLYVNECGVFKMTRGNFYEEGSTYTNIIVLQQGGVMCSQFSTITVYNATYYQVYGSDGGAYDIDGLNSQLKVYHSSFTKISMSNAGGIARFRQSVLLFGAKPMDQIFTNCTFTNIQTMSKGSGFYIDGYIMANLQLISCQFNQFSGTLSGIFHINGNSGGQIQLSSDKRYGQTIIRDFFVEYQVAEESSSLYYSNSQSFSLQMTDVLIECQPLAQNGYVLKKNKVFASIIKMKKSQRGIISERNIFMNCQNVSEGSIFSLTSTQLIDKNSEYYNNSAQQGGILACTNCTVSFTNSSFHHNKAESGGLFILYENYDIGLNNTQIWENSASKKGGIFFVNQIVEPSIGKNKIVIIDCYDCSSSNEGGLFKLSKVSYFYDYNSKYQMNSAVFGGVIHSSQSNVYLNETQFQDNQANRGGCIELSYDSYLFMNKVTFKNNQAYSSAGVIFIQSRSYFDAFNTIFSSNKANDSSNKGSFLFISLDVKLYIENSSFMRGFAIYGGALFISGDSEIIISRSIFIDNQVVERGGAIYADGFSTLNITQKSTLTNNLAFYGDDIHISNSNGIFCLDEVTIENPNAKSSIIVNDAQVYFFNVIMKNIGIKQQIKSQGSGLACFNCLKINIISSLFENLHGSLGGALYLNQIDLRKTDNVQGNNYFMKDVIFKNSKAYAGGAIYMDNLQILFLDNCTFINNQALTIDDSNYKSQNGSGGAIYYDCNQQLLKCSFTILNQNKFEGNIASVQGGAIHWTNIEPELSEDTNFENNLSYLYGNNISCFAQNIVRISQSDYDTIIQAFSTVQSNRLLKSSKASISYKLEEFSITADSTNKIRLIINATNTLNDKYPPIIEGDSTFYLQYGLTEIKDVAFAGTPGENYSVLFLTEAIDKTKRNNINYMNQRGIDQIDFKIDIQLRECKIGEQFTSSGKCVQCPSGLSFSLIKMQEPGSCQVCPTQKAICNGGTFMGPKPGYWRKDNKTSNFLRCINDNSCLGMIPPEYDLKGTCLIGYQGILCQDCIVGYSRVQNQQCSKCPQPHFNILRLLSVFLLSVFIVLFLIRSTLNGAKDKRNITSVYLKILMNHLQIIVLTAQFEFQWPQRVLDFYDGVKPVAQSSYQILSIDCFLDMRAASENSCNFRCMDIDSDQRIEEDLEVVCWSDFHNFISYFIAAPSILVWGIGIPFFALVILFKHRFMLEQNALRERYDWLKNEPELKNFLILTEDEKMFFFSVILISNLLFFMHWLNKMFKENLKASLINLGFKMRVRIFMMNSIEELYLSGKLILNKKSVEKLQLIFHPDHVLKQLNQGGSQDFIDSSNSGLYGSFVKLQERQKLRKERKLKMAKILNETSIEQELLVNDLKQGEKGISFLSNKETSKNIQNDSMEMNFNNALTQDKLNEDTRYIDITQFNDSYDKPLLQNNQSTPRIVFQKNSIEFETDQEEEKQEIQNGKSVKRICQDRNEHITQDDTKKSQLNHKKSLFNNQSKMVGEMQNLNFYLLQKSFDNQSQIQDDDMLKSLGSRGDIQKFKSQKIENDEQDIIIRPKRIISKKPKEFVNKALNNYLEKLITIIACPIVLVLRVKDQESLVKRVKVIVQEIL
ncbi:UNKNOWN [Stylonychia lemnae]|uniref:Transmembrane protein n=1 Tax=Stylonychia lemnae TaxID=5949 RepID=A0A078AUK1_STYLE|nr:UNKNOWN [Stylonychia lemnae]|eukprot:CDW86080.1 UNKNOWN [Stylonychia lemnae]